MKLLIAGLGGMMLFPVMGSAAAVVNKTGAGSSGKILVVYYSRTGNTKQVAELIAEKYHADIRRIEEIKKRKWLPATLFFGGYEAMNEKCSELKPMDFSLEGYDLIFVGSPVWASKPVPAVNSFVAQADFKNKNVALFFTMGGTKYEKAIETLLNRISEKGGIIKGAFAVQSGDNKKMLENAEKSLNNLDIAE